MAHHNHPGDCGWHEGYAAAFQDLSAWTFGEHSVGCGCQTCRHVSVLLERLFHQLGEGFAQADPEWVDGMADVDELTIRAGEEF